jgi:hypothetical protein
VLLAIDRELWGNESSKKRTEHPRGRAGWTWRRFDPDGLPRDTIRIGRRPAIDITFWVGVSGVCRRGWLVGLALVRNDPDPVTSRLA